jgi:xanthosine utilization system XapX-like protein
MIFEIPEAFKGIGYQEGLDLYLWIVFIFLSLLSSLIFLKGMTQTKYIAQKQTFFCFFMYNFCLGVLTRAFYIIAVYIPEYYDTFTSIGYFTTSLGVFSAVFILEKYYIHSYRIFTIISFTIVIFGFILMVGIIPRTVEIVTIAQIFVIPCIFSLVGIFIFLISKTSHEIRKKTIALALGTILLYAGYMVDSETVFSSFSIPLILPPILALLGFIGFIIGLKAIAILPDFFLSKKICVVHKGEIKSKVVFCKNCNIIYCERCFKFIMESDNMCWYCKQPLTKEGKKEIAEEKKASTDKDKNHKDLNK